MRRRKRSTFGLSGLTADDMPAIATYLADVARWQAVGPPAGPVRPAPIPSGKRESLLHGSRERAVRRRREWR